MSKPIASMMQTQAMAVDMDATLQQVDEMLRANNLSALPVTERSGALVGIISARDLAHFRHEKRNPAEVRAWEICSYKPVEVAPDASVSDVARIMVTRGIHHVVVADGKGIVGIVSALDFVKQFVEDA
ncbi:CBS domain-containing protein [Massilia sp. R2A-15]|uniref:CBS domain-containing protein n=1 Tax=Massilia sp. R2A-15 TaxID=3064278 RepID=UPI0027373459|nr:CBS domain-containing protein [Massilia sp. R2A-15]WLI90729.1 CBS domain-containing protein [Massilia sp. R2A-15]